MRRVGKSVLLRQYREFLLESGVDEKNILLINKESLEFDFISNYQELYNFIKKTVSPQAGVKHLLIDEIQEIDQWEKAINSFFAEGTYDITVTGSNARMFSTELSTLLAGMLKFLFIRFLFRNSNRSGRKRIRRRIPANLLNYIYAMAAFPASIHYPSPTKLFSLT